MDGICETCGTKMINGVCPMCSGLLGGSQAQRLDSNNRKFKDFFMNPKEKFVCALGNSYLQNFLSHGFIGNGFAVVSDRRVYFRGKSYEINNDKFKIKTVSTTVDLKDVTGTEVRTIKFPVWMFLGITTLILGIIAIIAAAVSGLAVWGVTAGLAMLVGMFAIITYFTNRMTIITIMFGGGGFAFPINWFSAQESETFQKQLRIAKDSLVEEAGNAAANTMREVMATTVVQQPAISSADELAKYAQLFKDGLISEQEFADIKAKILSKQG